MKRHKSLYPLSHDHHHALVQTKRLQNAASLDQSEKQRAIEQFLAFWTSDLQPHFRLEEEILLPVFARYVGANHPEIVETLVQHVEIRLRVLELSSQTVSNSFNELAQLLVDHIRYEENRLFPAIEEAVPEEDLWRINKSLTK